MSSSSSSSNMFSKFFPNGSGVRTKSTRTIPRKENFRNNSKSGRTTKASKEVTNNNNTWLTTKKRGRDDEKIANDKRLAEQIHKIKKRRTQGIKKPPRKNYDSSSEDEEDNNSINDFIAQSDDDIECNSSSSDEEEAASSFLPKIEKPCKVKKVSLQTLHNIQVKNNSRTKKKKAPPPKKIATLSAKYLNRHKKDSISISSDNDDIPPPSNVCKDKEENKLPSSTTNVDMSSPQDIVFKKRSRMAIHVSSSSDDEKNQKNRLIIQSDDDDDDDDDIPIAFGKKLSNHFQDSDDEVDLLSDDDEPKATTKTKRLQKQKSIVGRGRAIDLCQKNDKSENIAITLLDETEITQKNQDESNTMFIQSDDDEANVSLTKNTNRLKKSKASIIKAITTNDPFSESDDDDIEEEDDNNDEDDNEQYEEAERETGSILTSVNQLSAQILQRMREWCFGSSSSSSKIPKGMICDGAIALFKQDIDSYDESKILITKSILKEILSPNIQLKEYQWIGVNWMALLHTMKCNVDGKKTNVNGVLADEMGLGKTIQTIAFLAWLKYYRSSSEHKPHIIIVPASVLSNWQNEFKKVCPSLLVVKYHGTMNERCEIKEELRKSLPSSFNQKPLDVVLTTFSYFSSEKSDDRSFLKKFSFDYMVVDEAHCLKNPKGSRYKNMDKFNTEHRLLLTGTPVQNSAEQLMSLLCFLMPLFSKKKGGGGFDDNDDNDGGARMLQHLVTLGGKSEQENYYKLKQLFSPFVLRRKKTDCLNQMLPAKTRKLEFVPLTRKVRSMYDSIISSHIEWKRSKNDSSSAVTTHLFTDLRKAANHPLLLRNRHKSIDAIKHLSNILYTNGYFGDQCNLNLVKKELQSFSDYDIHGAVMTILGEKPYLKNELNRYIATEDDLFESPKFALLQTLIPSLIQDKHRILIFSQWTRCLDLIEHLMEHLNMDFMRLDGQTSVSERQRLIDEFTNDEKYKVFLLSTRAGGLGINLTCADTCILHDLDFNPFNDLQAEDRCHRFGQTKPVTVIKMVAEDTVETDIHAMQERKAKMNAAILENETTGTKAGKNKKVQEEKEVSNILQTAMDRYLTQH